LHVGGEAAQGLVAGRVRQAGHGRAARSPARGGTKLGLAFASGNNCICPRCPAWPVACHQRMSACELDGLMIDPGSSSGLRDRPGPGGPDVSWLHPSPLLLRARRIEVAAVTVPAAISGGLAGQAISATVGIAIAVAVILAGLVAERF